MAKHTTKPTPPGTVRPPASPPSPSSNHEPAPDAPRPDSWRPPARWLFFVLLFWLGGFLVLMLMLFAESLPLLWDLIRLRFCPLGT